MKKWTVDVKEFHIIEGQRVATTSSHIVDADNAIEARILFASKAFPNEKVESVTEYVAPLKSGKSSKLS